MLRLDAGWREYGAIDMAGAPLNLAARVGGYAPSDTEVASRFASREKVFAGYGNGAGGIRRGEMGGLRYQSSPAFPQKRERR